MSDLNAPEITEILQTGWAVMILYPEGTYPSKGDIDQLTLKMYRGIDTPEQVEHRLRCDVAFPEGTKMLVFPLMG